MSIQTTKAALAALLWDIATPQPPAAIYADAAEVVTLGDLPVIILSLAPQTTHTWRMAASGLARHDYAIRIWIIVGSRHSIPIGELMQRAEVWPEPLARLLFANLTLGDAVEWLGDVDSEMLYTYQEGEIPWGQDANNQPITYWGLVVDLPVTEKPVMAMDGGA